MNKTAEDLMRDMQNVINRDALQSSHEDIATLCECIVIASMTMDYELVFCAANTLFMMGHEYAKERVPPKQHVESPSDMDDVPLDPSIWKL